MINFLLRHTCIYESRLLLDRHYSMLDLFEIEISMHTASLPPFRLFYFLFYPSTSFSAPPLLPLCSPVCFRSTKRGGGAKERRGETIYFSFTYLIINRLDCPPCLTWSSTPRSMHGIFSLFPFHFFFFSFLLVPIFTSSWLFSFINLHNRQNSIEG